MKKHVFCAICVMLASVGGVYVSRLSSSNNSLEQNLLMENVEALSDGENSTSCSASTECYEKQYDDNTGKWVVVHVGSVSCSGRSCSRTSNGVECDGEETNC